MGTPLTAVPRGARTKMFSRGLRRFGTVAVAVSGAAAGYMVLEDANKRNVLASWTTGVIPSVKWDWNWDKREPTSLVKPLNKNKRDLNNNSENTANSVTHDQESLDKVKPTASRHLIFIRHGQYNLEGATDIDRYLSELGREQAALTGERLKDLSLPYTRFVHSTMTRATETAEIIMDKMDKVDETVEKCDLLREGAPIPPEPPIGTWRPEMHQFYSDGARIEAAFRKYVHRASVSQEKDSYEIFVCHANVIRYFVCRGLQLPPEAWLRMSLHNGSITYMVVRPDGRVALRQLGECGFMAPNKLSLT